MTRDLHVVVISRQQTFAGSVWSALTALTAGSDRQLISPGASTGAARYPEDEFRLAVDRSRRFLDLVAPDDRLLLTVVPDVDDLVLDTPGTLALLVLDLTELDRVERPDREVSAVVERCRQRLPASIRFDPSPCTVLAYHPRPASPIVLDSGFSLRWSVTEPWLMAADVVCVLTDSVQALMAARFTARSPVSALGKALLDLLARDAGDRWGLHYYTGSSVAALIDELEQHARVRGNPVLRGPSEHGLAAGALARWQLDGAPFLIVTTSGMVDEFRGTLANLHEAGARGVIVCAESTVRQWWPFQGTVHEFQDSRQVLAARGLRWVYLADPAAIDTGLAEVAGAYHAGDGPVVVLATKAVLEAVEAAPLPPVPAGKPVEVVREDRLAQLRKLVNTEPVRLLAQVGQLDPEDTELLYDIARRSGLALVDSLTRPGTVSGYHHGCRVEEYLGTLSLYGYSPPVHHFLHERGKLRPRARQALLFLNCRVPEVATPFSPRVLDQRLTVLQAVPRPELVAPFTDLGLVGDVSALLRALWRGLDVAPDVLAARRAAIAAATGIADDVVSTLPLQPMTANHFFHRLRRLLDDLITQEGYSYTGVYDVGRGGLSAVCNLPRTGLGFSGWFGRALMGDALQAVPSVALTRPDNVLAFVGDGAAALTPDILPTLVHQLAVAGLRLRGNLSIFRLVNGAHSVIRTYREGYRPANVSHQTSVLSLRDENWEWQAGDTHVTHQWIERVDESELGKQLSRPNTINLFSVMLSHNNEGDGLSLMSSFGWQRAELASLTRVVATQRTGRPGTAERKDETQ